MRFEVMLCGFFRLLSSVQVVSVRDVRMMRRFFVAPALMVLRRFFVVSGRMFMVLGRFQMMFYTFFAHKEGIGGFFC